MWFKRHPEIKSKLERQLESDLITPDAISEDLLHNGAFDKVPCVEKWGMHMRGRGAGETAIKHFSRMLRQICRGELPQKKGDTSPREVIENWGLKHPARLTLDDGLRYITELRKRNLRTREFRLVLRNFLKSKNVEGYDRISGALESSAGKYAHLYATKEEIEQILNYLKAMNEDAYLASRFSYKTASRMTATLEADSSQFSKEEMLLRVYEKAALHQAKKEVWKIITPDLYEELKTRLERGGKLFNISAQELNGLLRAAYQQFIPKLAEEIPMPFHFWRHQFAQHMLRATGWNYGIVAALGNWTPAVLEKYYGKIDRNVVLNTGKELIPRL